MGDQWGINQNDKGKQADFTLVLEIENDNN